MGIVDSKNIFTSTEKKFITSAVIKKNKDLENCFNYYKGNRKYIIFEMFCRIVNFEPNSSFAKKLYIILSDRKERLTEERFFLFYFIFAINNSSTTKEELDMEKQIKKKFWTEVLFNYKDEIEQDIFNNNFLEGLSLPEGFLNNNQLDNLKSSKGLINKKNFISSSTFQNLIFQDNFFKERTISNYAFSSTTKKFDPNLCIVCDCLKDEQKQEQENEVKKIKKENENKIMSSFKNIERNNKGQFLLSEFNKLFSKVNIEQPYQEIMIEYINKITSYRGFIFYNEYYNLNNEIEEATDTTKRAKLSFKILNYPEKEKIKVSKAKELIKKLLPEAENVKISSEVSLEDYMNNEELNDIKEKMTLMLNKINLIPYLFFGAIPFNLLTLKNCILYHCEDHELYDIPDEVLLKEKELICINKNFVQGLKEHLFSGTPQGIEDLKINFEEITDKRFFLIKKGTKIAPFLSRSLEYKKDFFLISNKVYNILKHKFNTVGEIIKVNRVEFNIKEKSKEEGEIDNYIYQRKEIMKIYKNNDGCIREIDLYPVNVLCFGFKNFKDLLEQEGKKFSKENVIEETFKKYLNSIGYMLSRHTPIYEIINIVSHRNQWEGISAYTLNEKKDDFIKIDLNSSLEDINLMETFHLYIDFQTNISGYTQTFYEIMSTDGVIDPKKIEEENLRKQEEERKRKEKLEKLKIENEKKKEMEKKEREALKESEKLQKEKEKKEREAQKEMQKEIEKDKEKEEKEKPKIYCVPFGLNNIGNTCYFNSVIQVLVNLPVLKDILLNKQISVFINKRSKFGHKGILIEEFLRYVDFRWKLKADNRISIISPNELKKIIGKLHQQFSGFDQQDSNELLNFIIDELNEELNLKDEKMYIQNPDDTFGHNTEQELSNIYWANSIRRSASFINALFAFQLKSILTCTKCGQTRISYETNTNLYVPIPLSKYINVTVFLKRLPLGFRFYYDEIDEEFKNYKNENKDKNLTQCLKDYFVIKAEKNKDFNLFNYDAALYKFDLILDKNQKISDFIKKIQSIPSLELEKDKNIENEKETIVNNLTSFLVLSVRGYENKIFYHHNEMKIDDCFPNGTRIIVIELLNSNGIQKLKNEQNNFSLIHKEININKINTQKSTVNSSISSETPTESSQELKGDEENKILSMSNYLTYSSKSLLEEIPIKIYEFPIRVMHFTPNLLLEDTLFSPYMRKDMNILHDFILLNTSKKNNYTSLELYDFIWEKSSKFFSNPNKSSEELWWRTTDKEHKLCYPFIIKLCKEEKREYRCYKCNWYKFCMGCTLVPDNSPVILPTDVVIVVEWCNKLIKKEFLKEIVNHQYNIEIEKSEENKSSLTIEPERNLTECLDLFFEKEKLEDEIKCPRCNSLEIFEKNYQIDKLPQVLVITLKRFKFTSTYNNKISTYITYPIEDFELSGEKFDLYGVINHMGSMGGGHYVSIAKIEGRWIYFDDSRVREISPDEVISRSAYILLYVNKSTPENKMYYQIMKSILDKVNLKENEEFLSSSFKGEKSFSSDGIFGEPVDTEYGKGYFIKKKEDGFYEVKYTFGTGSVRNCDLSTKLEIGKKIIPKEEKKKVTEALSTTPTPEPKIVQSRTNERDKETNPKRTLSNLKDRCVNY